MLYWSDHITHNDHTAASNTPWPVFVLTVSHFLEVSPTQTVGLRAPFDCLTRRNVLSCSRKRFSGRQNEKIGSKCAGARTLRLAQCACLKDPLSESETTYKGHTSRNLCISSFELWSPGHTNEKSRDDFRIFWRSLNHRNVINFDHYRIHSGGQHVCPLCRG